MQQQYFLSAAKIKEIVMMKRWIDAVKSSNESAPHAEKSEDC